MADDLMRLSEYPEASDEQMTNDTIMEVSVVDQGTASGFESRKSPLSRLANYILNKYASLNLGGSTRTVKAAIDAQAQDMGSLFTIKSYSAASVTISSGSSHGYSAVDFNVSAPDGYTPMALVYYSTGQANGLVYSVNARASGDGRMMSVMNVGSGSLSVAPAITIMYVKSGTYYSPS